MAQGYGPCKMIKAQYKPWKMKEWVGDHVEESVQGIYWEERSSISITWIIITSIVIFMVHEELEGKKKLPAQEFN